MMIESSAPLSPITRADVESTNGHKNNPWFVRFFELDKHLAEDWVRCIKNLDPYILGFLRLFFFINTVAAILFSFTKDLTVIESQQTNLPGKFFFKLTNLSGIALAAYFAIMGWLSLRFGRSRTHWGPLRRFLLNSLHFSCWMFQIVITPIYWGPLKGYKHLHPLILDWWQDFSMHGFGLIFLTIELVLVKYWYVCWKDTITSIGLFVLYMFWMWISTLIFIIYKKDGGSEPWWPYNIYKFSHKLAAVFYIATFVGSILISLMIVGFHNLKNRFCSPSPIRN
jgi:hypothetical protein